MTTTTTTPAARFRGYAETERRFAEKKRNNGTQHQNPTRRRLEMLRGTELDARRADERQGAYLALADGWDDDTLPGVLRGLSTKKHVERLCYIAYGNYPNWDSELADAGLTPQTYLGAAQALRYIAVDVRNVDPVAEQIKAAKRNLFGANIPGFFPTPDDLADRLVRQADIRTGMTVLEPSAGWGNIADAVRRAQPSARLILFEVASPLLEILNWKGYCTPTVHGHNLFRGDFLKAIPGAISGYQLVDRAVLNPPFEGLQDIDHVMHAYTWLKPGGRLVAIMSPSPFFRQDKKAVAFQQWLDTETSYDVADLPDGSFAKGERPTNVATRLVVIDKV